MFDTRRTCWWILGLVVAIELVILYQIQGPSPRGADAPPGEFSAERAVAVLERILGDQTPHPVGSLANDQVRERLITELRGLGLDVEIQESSCVVAGRYMPLHNVLARLPGTPDSGRPLVLCTHYDSVAAGPGAADAGSCVAALLETARALQHTEPLRRPVYLLFTDGEEAGLQGARAFVAEHALARAKPFVLNFDARGTSGPSLMYETHRGNLATVRWLARSLPRPCCTGSAFVTVYRTLPNDTDFSAFCRDGWTGLNFAFIDGAHRYHSADDTLENLSGRSVQHHGANALALARTIGGSDDIDLQASPDDAVFFDLLGILVVYFPEPWTWPLSAAVCVILLLCGVWRFRCRAGIRALGLTVLAILVALGLSAALGWGLARGLTAAGLLASGHVAHGRWLAAFYWLPALGILWFVVRYVLRGVARADVWAAFWLVWSIAGLAVAWWVPGFSYMLLVPALAATLLSLLPASPTVRLVISVGVAWVMLLPLANTLPVAFGPGPGLLLCGVCTLVLFPLLPLADNARCDE